MSQKSVTEQLDHFKANGISRDPKRVQEVLDWQDVIGTKTSKGITALWESLEEEHRTIFIWACGATLSPQMLYVVVKCTFGHDCKLALLKSLEKEFEEVQRQEMAVGEARHKLEREQAEFLKDKCKMSRIRAVLEE